MNARERVRVGVVGCGMVAQAEHLQNLLQLSHRFEIAALADPSRTVREAMASRYAVSSVHEDFRELLSAGELPPAEFSRPEVAQVLIEAYSAE